MSHNIHPNDLHETIRTPFSVKQLDQIFALDEAARLELIKVLLEGDNATNVGILVPIYEVETRRIYLADPTTGKSYENCLMPDLANYKIREFMEAFDGAVAYFVPRDLVLKASWQNIQDRCDFHLLVSGAEWRLAAGTEIKLVKTARTNPDKIISILPVAETDADKRA